MGKEPGPEDKDSLDSKIEAYQEITQDYLKYLDGKSAPLSSWRFQLTNVFYRGKHARWFVWDILAGGVQNNFMFEWVKKPEHAVFISLINRIALLDRCADVTLQGIFNTLQTESKAELCNAFFKYFTLIDNQYSTQNKNKDETYYRNMRGLKQDINRFAEECGVEERIVKIKPESGKHYTYKLVDKAQNKQEIRAFKTMWKRWTKAMAGFMAFVEIFVGLTGISAGLATLGLTAMPFIAIVLLKITVAYSAAFFGYLFAKEDLFSLGKQLFLGRIFKIKNPTTGQYESLTGCQKFFIGLLSPFSMIAGFCISSLVFYSMPSAIVLPLIGCSISLLPLTIIAAPCVFLLATAAFFLTIKNIVSHITKEQVAAYFKSLGYQEGKETIPFYIGRLAVEILKWMIALVVMAIVGMGGYYLFKDKSVNMLHKVWQGLSVITVDKIAGWMSFLYSSIKFIFGSKKVMDIFQVIADSIKEAFTSKKEDVSSPKLNRMQQEVASSWASYFTTTVTTTLLLTRTLSTAGLYGTAVRDDHVVLPVVPSNIVPGVSAGSAAAYSAGIYGASYFKGNQQQKAEPLECDTRSFLKK